MARETRWAKVVDFAKLTITLANYKAMRCALFCHPKLEQVVVAFSEGK